MYGRYPCVSRHDVQQYARTHTIINNRNRTLWATSVAHHSANKRFVNRTSSSSHAVCRQIQTDSFRCITCNTNGKCTKVDWLRHTYLLFHFYFIFLFFSFCFFCCCCRCFVAVVVFQSRIAQNPMESIPFFTFSFYMKFFYTKNLWWCRILRSSMVCVVIFVVVPVVFVVVSFSFSFISFAQYRIFAALCST